MIKSVVKWEKFFWVEASVLLFTEDLGDQALERTVLDAALFGVQRFELVFFFYRIKFVFFEVLFAGTQSVTFF